MRKSLLVFILVVTSITAVFYACTKTDKLNDTYDPGPTVTASVKGRVTDLNKVPLANATVTAGSSSTTTNINGEFTLANVSLNKNTGFVKVKKAGFFNGSRTFTVSTVSNYISIQLIPKIISGTFTASSGGDITVATGGTIKFSANSVVNASTGAAYTGDVTVSAFTIDPTKEGFQQYMPGDLRGITTNNEQKGLQSYGMMAVELNGTGGEQLQIATGKTATLTLPIPAAMQANAHATIPLWYFDEAKGMWVEEGSATKQGNNYIGDVKHFSWWNCDMPLAYVNLSARFVDQNGMPMARSNIEISSSVYGSRNGYTDDSGYVAGIVPKDEILIMRVYNHCNTGVIFSREIGPFNEDSNLGIISIQSNPVYNTTVTGMVKDCNNAIVINGFVEIRINGVYYRTDINNGNFTYDIQHCDNSDTAYIIATNTTAGMQSSTSTVVLNSNNISTGEISACSLNTDQFMSFSVDGHSRYWTFPNTGAYSFAGLGSPGDWDIEAKRTDTSNLGIFFRLFTNDPITISNNNWIEQGSIQIYYNLNTLPRDDYGFDNVGNVSITEAGGPGEYIAGHFTCPTHVHSYLGIDSSQTNDTLHQLISVSFRLKRQ